MLDGEFTSEHTFMPIGLDGSWISTKGEFAGTLADFLAMHDIIVDPDCQFSRIVRYDQKYRHTYEYRVYDVMHVSVKYFKTLILS